MSVISNFWIPHEILYEIDIHFAIPFQGPDIPSASWSLKRLRGSLSKGVFVRGCLAGFIEFLVLCAVSQKIY